MSLRSRFTGAALLVVMFCGAALAQDEQLSKVDVFAGYAWVDPGGEINGQQIGDIPGGLGASVTYFWTENAGFTLDAGGHFGDDTKLTTVQIGPTFRLGNFNNVVPFVKGLVGLHYLNADPFGGDVGIGLTAGGGLDLATKWQGLSVRLIEADFLYGHHNYPGNRVDAGGARLRSGLVFKFGSFGPPPATATATCSAQPTEVFEGEPVTITATGNNFNPKRSLTYNWSPAPGVKIEGTGQTVNVDTKGMQPGTHPVRVTISDGRKTTADCTANVVIKQPRAPSITCSISPTQVQTGQSANVSCQGSSPDNRTLSYNHRASGGQLTPNGPNATLSTAGAQPGTIDVDSTVTDDRNLSATDRTSLRVVAPPPPPPAAPRPLTVVEQRLSLRSVYFPTGQPTKANPKGGLLLSQQRTLIPIANDFREYLRTKPGARLKLEGFADPRGDDAMNQALTERRVQRVKEFLVERGVPEASIDVEARGEQAQLSQEEVQSQVDRSTQLTEGEKGRLKTNIRTITLANNRRVDITLVMPDRPPQASEQEYPFNAEDALSLIGGRERPPAPKRPATRRKTAPKRP